MNDWHYWFLWAMVILNSIGVLSSISKAAKGQHTIVEKPGINALSAVISLLIIIGFLKILGVL